MDGLPGKCSSASSASCAVCDPCRTGSCGPRPCRNAVDLDLPVIADEMGSVRWDHLDSVTVVSELGRRGYSAIWIDVEIWRVFRRHELISFVNWILVLSHATISVSPIETDGSRSSDNVAAIGLKLPPIGTAFVAGDFIRNFSRTTLRLRCY
jgi:hypothetical protein